MNSDLNSTPQRQDEGLIDRRTLTKAAAWSIPVMAAAVAVPLAAASTEPQINLWSTARLPSSAADGVYLGNNYYQGPRSLAFTYTFGNLGPDTLPAGALLTIGLPFASIWQTATLSITNSDGYALSPAGTRTENIATEPVLAVRQLWDFTLGTPLPAGASFTVSFTVQMNATSNTATDYWQVRTTSYFQTGTGVTDTDPSNNNDYADNYAYFNHTQASTAP